MIWKTKKYLIDSKTLKDGRIVNLCKTGLIEGKLIVPVDRDEHGDENFQDLKRLKNLKIKEKKFNSYDDILKIARKEKAKIITVVEEIKKLVGEEDGVIYLNDLFIALMPVYYVGDTIQVYIDKKGRKDEEGIGYHKIGTKVVVEGGGKYVGKRIRAVIVGVVKTEAGQTIFGKVNNGH